MVAPRTAQRYCDGAADGLTRPPRSSFGHGAAGIAYFLYRTRAITGDPASLDRAAEWSAVAESGMTDAGAFAGPPPVFPDARMAPPSSVLFGEAGVWWVAALVDAARGAGAERAVGRFCTIAAACPDDRFDVAAGAAGLLLATAALVDLDRPRLVPVGDALARRLEREIDGSAAGAVAWLGAAHGWAGIATALLRWCQATGTPPGPALTTLLDALPETRLAAGVWPRRHGSTEVWPGWCHGSAGWAQLWVLAATVLGDDRLLAVAERPAVHAILGRAAGASLCCGLAGQAYAALALYRATGEPTWLAHGRRLAEEAGAGAGADLPAHSLWGGDLGVRLLGLEMEEPALATMPLYG